MELSRVRAGNARMTRELALNALQMARFQQKPQPGLIHHSDRGSQYCSHDHQALIADMKAVSSMSGKGNCWDRRRWKAGSTA